MDLDKIRQEALRLARRGWMRSALRNVSNNDDHGALERAYWLTDPWNLDSPLEHARFAATNRLLERRFGRVNDLLEIGCGEGLQSTYLLELTDRLHGIDVSATAVARARQRLPQAHFHVGDLVQQQWTNEGKRFDLVVACEVLYYVQDVGGMLAAMNALGKSCFVSFYVAEAHKLSHPICSIPNVEQAWFSHQGVTWLMAWWDVPEFPVQSSD